VTTELTIRPLTAGLDWDQYADLSIRAFGPQDPSLVRAVTEPVVADGRGLGAFAGDRLIGSALFLDMRQWWFGRAVPMAGVAGVTIAPEDRGRGVGRILMTALLELMAARGYPLSALYPATTSIYHSLGWEIAGHRYEAVLPARALFALAKPDLPPPPGEPGPLRRPGPGDAAEVIDVLGRAHAAARDCGPVTRDEATIRSWLTRPGRYADTARYAYLAPDGFVGYRWQRGNEEVFVDRLVAASAQTTRALWGLVASSSSVADTVRAQVGPADPLFWLLREQDADIAERESWMLRLLDAPAAIAARGFPATDITVPLHITDDLRPANSGRWALTVQSGQGSLVRTGRLNAPGHPAAPAGRTPPAPSSRDQASLPPHSPDQASLPPGSPERTPLALGPRGLAALYAGTPVATLRRSGLAAGGDPAGDAALDGAFAANPFMLDGF
jgi:predicted acetyltransferase